MIIKTNSKSTENKHKYRFGQFYSKPPKNGDSELENILKTMVDEIPPEGDIQFYTIMTMKEKKPASTDSYNYTKGSLEQNRYEIDEAISLVILSIGPYIIYRQFNPKKSHGLHNMQTNLKEKTESQYNAPFDNNSTNPNRIGLVYTESLKGNSVKVGYGTFKPGRYDSSIAMLYTDYNKSSKY